MVTFLPADPIVNPTPATGLLLRRPRWAIYVDGQQLQTCLSITTSRGLDQELATCDIVVPYPLPAFVRHFSHIQVLIGVDSPDPEAAYTGLIERFVGYCITFQNALWPGALTIHCEDALSLAKYGYTPAEVDLSGDTDKQAVYRILTEGVGYQGSMLDLGGQDLLLVDIDEAKLWWEVGQTALAAIQEIDSVSMGFRTWATIGGRIERTRVNTSPNAEHAVWWFGEGVDVLDGSQSSEIKDAKTEITISGWDGSVNEPVDPLDPDYDPWDWHKNSFWVKFFFLKTQAASLGILNPFEVARYILSQLDKAILKVTFSTHLDLPFQGTEVIGLTSSHLGVNQKFWIQNVTLDIADDGAFTQTLQCVSELAEPNRQIVTPPTNPLPGPGQPVTPITSPDLIILPSPSDVLVSFSVVAIDKELAAPADLPDSLGQAIYVAMASDQSTSVQGTIASRSWLAEGPGVIIAAGTEQTFTTGFSGLTDPTDPLNPARLTLTITDTNGQVKSLTQPVYSGAQPVRSRILYACTDTTYEAFDGHLWRSQPPVNAATVEVVGTGPYWAAGNYVAYSADFLATAPLETPAFPGGEKVSAIWVHETKRGFVAVGGEAGSVAVTHDNGTTWIQKTPRPSRITHIIVSIHDSNEIHVTTSAGWEKSQDEGASWTLVRAGSFLYLELAPARNIVVTTGGQLQQAETGRLFTGISGTVVAATAHIRKDVFYALCSDGTTWYCDGPGSYAMIAGEPIPAGTPAPAGAYRDGQIVDLVYFAAQDGGLFKTIDGFRTAPGYLRLRTVGRLTP